jgi:hypothetical protein
MDTVQKNLAIILQVHMMGISIVLLYIEVCILKRSQKQCYPRLRFFDYLAPNGAPFRWEVLVPLKTILIFTFPSVDLLDVKHGR